MNTLMKSATFTALLFGLAACNTIEGAGKDVEVVGEETQEAARDVKEDLTD